MAGDLPGDRTKKASQPRPLLPSSVSPETGRHASAKEGKTQAFPIQQDTLPDTLAGRDVLGRGKTGSGKTSRRSPFRFVARPAESGKGVRRGSYPWIALRFTRERSPRRSPRSSTCWPRPWACGRRRSSAASSSADRRSHPLPASIVVARPGRLEDLLQQDILTLENIEVTILDEADHMADLGFLPESPGILNQTRLRDSGCSSPPP